MPTIIKAISPPKTLRELFTTMATTLPLICLEKAADPMANISFIIFILGFRWCNFIFNELLPLYK